MSERQHGVEVIGVLACKLVLVFICQYLYLDLPRVRLTEREWFCKKCCTRAGVEMFVCGRKFTVVTPLCH